MSEQERHYARLNREAEQSARNAKHRAREQRRDARRGNTDEWTAACAND